jgi:uncharacterized protein YjiS (DUF1127 family)
MPFDGEWPGDTAAAPFCGTSNREDVPIESPGGRTWNRLDRRSGVDSARPPRDAFGTDGEPTKFAGRSGWITSIASIIAVRWSKRMRERGIRRLAAGWEKLDDRILKDIGVSRHEIEFRRDVACWR